MGVLDGWTGFTTKFIVDNGLDIENGIEISYLVFSSGAPANEAMVAGALDAAIIGGGATVPSLANLNNKMIMETNNDTIGMSLIARQGLAPNYVTGAVPQFPEVRGDADSVRGLTIITAPGTLQYYLTVRYLETIGLTERDVTIIAMDPNQGYQAFRIGEGDILACSNLFSFSLVNDGFVELASLTTLDSGATAQVVASEAAFSNERTFEALTVFVRLLAEVNDIMNNDLDLATDSFYNWVTLNGGTPDREISRAIMAERPYFGVEETRTRELGRDLMENFVEFFIMIGSLEEGQRGTVAANIRTDVLEAAGFR